MSIFYVESKFAWPKALSLLAFLVIIASSLEDVKAQTNSISGVVNGPEGLPIPGVNVLVKGTSQGTITDIEGDFTISLPGSSNVLIFSFIGFESKEIEIVNETEIAVTLEPTSTELDEVVVTALGVEREKRELGYSVQEVDGEQLNQARETNLVNSLAGKVAGVNVTSGNTGIGGSSRVTIRGEISLANDNQPLFVVDGIPINNQIFGSEQSGQDIDYGNGASEINPDDIANISVLKGPNAAALYGSRAANGVILITTKSGKGTRGIGKPSGNYIL